jgi:hypothetical protein
MSTLAEAIHDLETQYRETMWQREAHWDTEMRNAKTHSDKIQVREDQAAEAEAALEEFERRAELITRNFENDTREKTEAIDELSQALDDSEAKIAHDSSTIDSLQSGIGELSSNISELKAELKAKTTEIKQLDQKKDQLIHKSQKFKLTAQQLQSCLSELHAHKQTCQESARLRSEELRTCQKELTACRAGIAELEEIVASEKRHHTSLLEQLEHYTLKNQHLESELVEHKRQLTLEKLRLSEVQERSKLSADEQREVLKQELEVSHHRTRNLLESCAEKLKITSQDASACESRILELEATIGEMKSSGTYMTIDQISELRNAVHTLGHENAQLKAMISQFQSQLPRTDLVKMIEDTHHTLAQNLNETKSEISHCEAQLLSNNQLAQSQAAEITLLRAHTHALETKIKSCLFPGEKRVLMEQLERTIAKRNEIAEVSAKVIAQNRELVRESLAAKAEHRRIANILEKHRLDMESMRNLVSQSAGLNAQLVEAQKSIREKDAQLAIIAKQLEVVLAHSKTHEKTSDMLKSKLRFSTSPEQMESLNSKLIQCQNDFKQTNTQAEHLANVILKLEEHNRLSDAKIRSLIEVLKLTEDSKIQLMREQDNRRLLEDSLAQCSAQKAQSEKSLTDRLQALEKQYQDNLVQHARVMNDAAAKIAQLESKQEPARMEAYAAAGSTNLEDSRNKYFQDMQQKEVQIMQAREQVLDEVRAAIAQNNPTSLESRIADIYARGDAREQQYNKDMLELQAVNEQLARQYDSLKQAQWKNLQQVNQQNKREIVDMVQKSNPQRLPAIEQTRDELAGSQNAWVSNAKRDLEVQLEAQNRYATHLKSNILPKMRQTEAMIEELDMPALNQLQEKMARDSRTAIASLDREENESEDQRRSISLLEDKLKALQVERNRLSTSITDWIKAPGPRARTDVIEAANADHTEIARRMRASAQLNDPRNLRINLVVAPRTPEQVAAGIPSATPEQMRLNQDKNQIIITQGGQESKFHGTTLSVLQDTQTIVPQPRFDRAIIEKKDLIVVSYAYQNAENAKYKVFLNAVEKLFGTIQKFMGDNKVFQISMVRISSAIRRLDLLNDRILPDDCDLKTCKASKMDIKSATSAKAILDQIKTKLPDSLEDSSDYHVVLSLFFPGHTIHIVDVLFSSGSATDIRLLDKNWLDYLRPCVQDGNFYIDLYFNVLSTSDARSLHQNNEMLQLSYRISKFLSEFQTIVSRG